MGTKCRICLVIVALSFLISFISAGSTASRPFLDDQLSLNESQITNNESGQMDPAIYEDRIVWQDERNGNWDVYIYNLSTSTETQITTNQSNQTGPAIYEDRIVWQDKRNGNWDIYLYDLSTQKETQITNELADQINPAINKDRIVWQDKRNGNWDIYLYDLSTQKEIQITTNKSDQMKPVIYGDRIVWQNEHDGREICLHELSTSRMLFNLCWNNQNLDLFSIITDSDKSKVQRIINSLTSREVSITTYESNEYERPAVYGNKLVWADRRSTNLDNPNLYNSGIYVYDISSSVETLITTGFTSDESYLLPVIYEKRIVWQDGRNGNSDIYMFDVSTSTETRITTNESKQEMPSIYGNRIVWQDGRNGNSDIYMCTLAPANVGPLSPFSDTYKSGLSLIKELLSLIQ
jgi:TolB protein